MASRGFSGLVRSLVRVSGRMVRVVDLSARTDRLALVSALVALVALVLGTLLTVPPGSVATATTTWYVAPGGSDSNTCTSPSSPCQHIQVAINRATSGDAIDIAAGTYTETLTISTSLSLTGAGAGSTILDGNNQGTVLSVAPASTVTLSGMTIQHGDSGPAPGGGVNNQGDLTIVNCTIIQNAVYEHFGGGGIYNTSALTLTNTTVSDNSALDGYGGGIYGVGSTLSVINSTVSANSASGGEGGGIYNASGALTLANSTVSGNSAYFGGGITNMSDVLSLTDSTISDNSASGPVGSGSGVGGLFTYNSYATLTDSIIANNTAPASPDCSGALTSGGYNLVGIGDGCGLTNGQNGDQIGTSSSPINPLLGPLQNNGGPTWTMALQPGSPAIDYVPPSNCILTADQRGEPRPDELADDGFCDIGAVEMQEAPLPTDTPTSTSTSTPAPTDTPTTAPTSTPTSTPTATSTPLPASLAVKPTSGVYRQRLTFTGAHFGPAETVDLYADSTNTPPVYTTTTDPTGAFALTTTVRQGDYGWHTIIGVGQTSGITATVPFLVRPSLVLSPVSGPPGTVVRAKGYGFGKRETVALRWNALSGTVLATTTSNAVGSVGATSALTFTVPASPTSTYRIYAVGKRTGARTATAFKVR